MRYVSPADPTIRYPGVSDIAALCRGSIEGLLIWANREGLAGRDHRETRKVAADIGTLVHRAAYEFLHGREPSWGDDLDLKAKAQRAFGAFLNWYETTALTVEAAEMTLVSDILRVGGRFDALALMGHSLVMADYKTGNSIYVASLVQVAGYALLWEEHFPDRTIEGYLILQFDRETGDLHVHHFALPFDEPREAFLVARRLWDLETALTKRLR
jgi:hypothetical protein